MSGPSITYRANGELASLNGREAVDLYAVQVVIMGIKMHMQTKGRIILTRGMTITKLLKIAGRYTGQTYKRTECQRALDELNVWFQTMKSSIPTRTEGEQ